MDSRLDTARYVLAVLLVVSLPPAVIWWYIVHPFVGFWRKLGPSISLAILMVLLFGSMAGLYLIRDLLVGRDLGGRLWLVAPAVACMIPTIWIAVARRKHLTMRILSGVPELQKDGKGGEVLKTGIYARVRHPRYIEVVLGTFAYAFLANYLGAYIVSLLAIPGLHLIVMFEERELLERFGDEYREYAARVPRYWPKWGEPG